MRLGREGNFSPLAVSGATQNGCASPGSYTYSVHANMGNKPVNNVSWFDVARVCNWMQNGATGSLHPDGKPMEQGSD